MRLIGSPKDPNILINGNQAMKRVIGIVKGLRDLSIPIIPTSGPKVCKDYLDWAILIPKHPYKLLVSIPFSICLSI